MAVLVCGSMSLLTATLYGAQATQVDRGDTSQRAASLPKELTFRARVIAIEPEAKVTINWRYGGEGLGGEVYRGTLARGLAIGQWTESVPLASLVKSRWPPAFQNRCWYLTFTVNDAKSRGLKMEFEFAFKGKTIKQFTVEGPDGATGGIVVPHYRLNKEQELSSAFIEELGGIKEYAQRRARAVGALPWVNWPLPKKFIIATDLGGYGPGIGYGIRHGDKTIVETEVSVLRQMGVNSLRSGPAFLLEMARKREGFARDMGVAEVGNAMGFPVPRYRKGRPNNDPECGCPFAPGVPERTRAAVAATLEKNLRLPVPEVWALTVDEIGSVFDHAPEGKKHLETCPRCIEAFRAYVRDLGAMPADFGQTDWGAVKPMWHGGPKATKYYTVKFNNYATAKLFTDLMKAFEAENAKKREALARGEKSAPAGGDSAAAQPWLYSYALRGNTFLMAGHSLDFFDFYRYADNAFVYEMSNRGWQIWQWDSYLCDVGRTVAERMNKALGVYVKPHRGAPLQRALTAIARGSRMIYWYTYGPDYWKGDSFADRPQALALVVKAAHLIGKTEEVLWGAKPARPAEVAIVKPRCSEILGDDAQWENAKWVYTALAHAHIPVDAIDEVMLATEDLSRYRIIYLNGSHLPRKSADALARYVEQGGILWTSGWGCARDEADEPLTALLPVLGLERRAPPELWYKVERYRATAVQSFTDRRSSLAPVPAAATIHGTGPYACSFAPVVGREVLKPTAATQVLARFADGAAAMTVHKHGKGLAYTVGFYPGLEYSATIRDGEADMSRAFDAARRNFVTLPALAVVRPPVTTSIPPVEAILLKNPSSGRHALVVLNWAYRRNPQAGATEPAAAEIVRFENVKISIRAAGNIRKATSAMLDGEIPIQRDGESIAVILPRLEEGDVLLLE